MYKMGGLGQGGESTGSDRLAISYALVSYAGPLTHPLHTRGPTCTDPVAEGEEDADAAKLGPFKQRELKAAIAELDRQLNDRLVCAIFVLVTPPPPAPCWFSRF